MKELHRPFVFRLTVISEEGEPAVEFEFAWKELLAGEETIQDRLMAAFNAVCKLNAENIAASQRN
jgi:hypothetical protein